MQIHLFAEVSTTFAGINEFAGELEAVSDVIRATTPFPIPSGGWCAWLVSIVTGTRLNAALAACSRDTVSHSRARDGIDESGLSTTYKKIAGNLWRVPCWKLNSPLSEREKWRQNSKSVVLKSMIYYRNLLPHYYCLFLLNFIYTELYNILYFSANFWRTKTLGSYDFVSIREVLYILDVGTFILLSTKR